ncbi:Outer membrane protein beta-barrel domain-containing protein [Devosia enhydra]|uniref:Outer membrane protein beta-barrel domain-containing protein n=1 Tax=Devosia enhydra TaxID=665118 RepID=A0A1K2HYF8_9HYPH|nr:Outer membrane protein beta-barrel domain-containing protein [Devosia enhydra]
MLAGPVVGASVGVGTPVPGLSAELDLMWTSAEYDYLEDYLRTLSLMANLEYTVALNDTFAVYGLAGAGLLNITFEDSVGETWSGTGPGYQLGAGVRAQLTDQVALYAEYKFQNSFGYVDVDGDDVSSPTSNVLLGLRFTP